VWSSLLPFGKWLFVCVFSAKHHQVRLSKEVNVTNSAQNEIGCDFTPCRNEKCASQWRLKGIWVDLATANRRKANARSSLLFLFSRLSLAGDYQ
jgi:hypothetical protein